MTILLVACAAFAATMLGGIFAIRFRDRLHLILGFSAGAVVGVALFDLLPEAMALGGKYHDPAHLALFIACGFLAYLVLDRLVLIHPHGHDEHDHGHNEARGVFGATTLSVHSFLDGAAIGIGFQASPAVGVIVAAAVIAHDFSDGINTVGFILKNGGQWRSAMRWLIVDAAAPVIGAASTLLFRIPELDCRCCTRGVRGMLSLSRRDRSHSRKPASPSACGDNDHDAARRRDDLYSCAFVELGRRVERIALAHGAKRISVDKAYRRCRFHARGRLGFGLAQTDRHARAAARYAFDDKLPVHALRKAARDDKAKAHAGIAVSRRMLEAFQLFRRNAGAVIRHHDIDVMFSFGDGKHDHAAFARKFDRIVDEPRNDLPERLALRKTPDGARQHIDLERDVLFRRVRMKLGRGFRCGRADIDGLADDLTFQRAQLRELRKIAHDTEKRLAARADIGGIFLIARRTERPERAFRKHIGETDDRIELRAQIMADRADDGRFGIAFLFGERGAFLHAGEVFARFHPLGRHHPLHDPEHRADGETDQ